MSQFKSLTFAAVAFVLAAGLARGARAEEPAQDPAPEPVQQNEIFTGTVMVTNAPATGIARLRITVERWTTDDERKKFAVAIRDGGSDGLVAEMEKSTAGYIQVENNLRWPIRSAATWKTDKGRMVRFATNRPMNINETYNQTRSMDYPIGVIELLLPPEGKGEGRLLVATRVQFNKEGKLEVESLPTNTGPQQVTNVESELAKPKKSKKKK